MLTNPYVVVLVLSTIIAVPVRLMAESQCPGDCDGDDRVTVHELVNVVRLALDGVSPEPCAVADLDGDQRIAINESITAIRMALLGCPSNGSVCPSIDIFGPRDGFVAFGCSITTGRGHAGSLTIHLFPDRAAAQRAFDQRAALGTPTQFAEFPAASWQLIEPHTDRRHLTWLAAGAVIDAESADESIYNTVPDPIEASQAALWWVRRYAIPTCVQ